MTELHCTLKLFKRIPQLRHQDLHSDINRLGPWCANVMNIGRLPTIIVTNERTLLTVIVPLKRIHTFWERALDSIELLLNSIAVPKEIIHHEIECMRQVEYNRKTNRQVLGSMNDFVFLSKSFFAVHSQGTLEELALELSHTPCSPLKDGFPDQSALKILTEPATNALHA